MSGWTALQTSRGTEALDGCGQDECLVSRLFAMTFVRSAGAVILGKKPAALFSFSCGGRVSEASGNCVCEVIDAYSRGLADHGMRLVVLGTRGPRVELLVWRPALVDEVLLDEVSRDFLRDAGHDTGDSEGLVRSLQARLSAFHAGSVREYPHEVGLILGYPLEDVRGYVQGGHETCRGLWRAYGDPEAARWRFARISAAQDMCRSRFEAGETIGALLA